MEEQAPSSLLHNKKRGISSPEVSARKRIHFGALFEELLLSENQNISQYQCKFRETASVGQSSSNSEDEEIMFKDDLQRSHEVARDQEMSCQIETKPILFSSGSHLSEEELLLYAALKGLFPGTPFKHFSAEKYKPIVELFNTVLKTQIAGTGISNYIRRALANTSKGFGKQNGILRWHYFAKFVL